MYNQEAIDALIKRIGWNEPVSPTDFVLSVENSESTSGRYFNAFNPFVTVEDVKKSIRNVDADDDAVNELLSQLRTDTVMGLLNEVYNLNVRATAPVTNNVISLNYLLDYSDVIGIKQGYFDQAIGLGVAVKTLQLLIGTFRSNLETVTNQANYAQLREYLEGAYTADGKLISLGLIAKYNQTVGSLINVLFPLKYPDGAIINPDGSVTLKEVPTLIARRIW